MATPPLDDLFESITGLVDDCAYDLRPERAPTAPTLPNRSTGLSSIAKSLRRGGELAERDGSYASTAIENGDVAAVESGLREAGRLMLDAAYDVEELVAHEEALEAYGATWERIARQMAANVADLELELARYEVGDAFVARFHRILARSHADALRVLSDPACAAGLATLPRTAIEPLLQSPDDVVRREAAMRLHRIGSAVAARAVAPSPSGRTPARA